MPPENLSAAKVVRFVAGRRYRPMTADEMAKALKVAKKARKSFSELVEELKLAGELVEVKNNRLADPARVDLMVGTLSCNPRGFGFIRPVREADGDDVYVSGENMSSAFHGDLVVARVPPSYRKAERQGRRLGSKSDVKVVSILKRARSEIVGTFRKDRHVRYVVPDNPRLFRDVVVAAEDTNDARHNDKVAVRITVWPTRHMPPEGEVAEVFGKRGRLKAEMESVVREYNLRKDFPPAVVKRAKNIPLEPRAADLKHRADLTDETILTIDPVDARDFDDAVSLEHLPGGGWSLGVHIADVAHFVRPKDPIDREALARGTSVYLPGQVIPMLPEELSNRACSLRPDEVHLTRTARMRFDAEGRIRSVKIFRSFIRSCRRFTYEEVQEIIEGGKTPDVAPAMREKILQMHAFAQLLHKRRLEQGMLELTIPEVHILTNDAGETTGVIQQRSDESHQLIEHCMLAANEAVANYLIRRNMPYICRAHDEPPPDALNEFRETVRSLGYNFPKPGTRKQIQQFLKKTAKKPDAPLLHYLLLRSMMQAEYSAQDRPHYAIGAAHYLHFTSPIRRYPDLLVHRLLDEEESGKLRNENRRQWWLDRLPGWAAHSTATERNAQTADRALTERRMMEFVAGMREPMDALIVSVESYGMRVQLSDSLMQGVVRMSALSDGFYRLDRDSASLVANSGKRYRVGQRIKVRVTAYDELKHQVQFTPVGDKRPSQRRQKSAKRR